MTLTDEKSLNLQVVDWLYRPFVEPYHGHKTITVVSGDTLEVNIEVRRTRVFVVLRANLCLLSLLCVLNSN